MFISGFTIVRNAVKYDYPIAEAITSILPLCNEFVVLVGDSDDNTLELIKNIGSEKIKIHLSTWNDNLRVGGNVLAEETNKAIAKISSECTWAFYIQADEVLHEKYLDPLKNEMQRWKDDLKVEGLLFNYIHFFGSYDFIADSRKWYRKEIRIFRPNIDVRSWKDAQGFRINGRPLRVKPANAFIYHYGWVKPPEKQQAKQKYFNRLWHDDQWVNSRIPDVSDFDYSVIDSVKYFEEPHPKVMKERIRQKNWKVNIDPSKKKLSLKNKILFMIEKWTGKRIGEYKNYRLIR